MGRGKGRAKQLGKRVVNGVKGVSGHHQHSAERERIILISCTYQEIIGDLDIDRDGECDLDAFINLCQRFHGRPLPTAKDLKEAFLTLDT